MRVDEVQATAASPTQHSRKTCGNLSHDFSSYGGGASELLADGTLAVRFVCGRRKRGAPSSGAGERSAHVRRRERRHKPNRKVSGVVVTDKHHGRAGTTFTVTRVHLSNDIASHVVSMDQRNGRFASGASAARGPRLGPAGFIHASTRACIPA